MNPSILFVDDEELILKGLRRMLASRKSLWNMSFVNSGEDALAFLRDNACDVIVTDLLMPGMDGHQLLAEVQKAYPNIRRIVLTGQPDRTRQADVILSAHQYIMKPCDRQTLVTVLENILEVEDTGMNAGLKGVLLKIDSLPALPDVYHDITEELNAKEPSIDAVSSLVARDPALSAKIVALANSPYYGHNRVSEPRQAVLLFGLNMIKFLVLSLHAFSAFKPKTNPGFSLTLLWDHCTRVANLAKHITSSREGCGKEQESQAFLAGLLHDIGKLVLAAYFPKQYNKVLTAVSREETIISGVEEEEFGVSHAKVGAYLMGLWGIPPAVSKALSEHHSLSPVALQSTPLFEVRLGNLIDHVHTVIHPEYNLRNKYQSHLDALGKAKGASSWKKAVDSYLKENNAC